MSEVIKVSQEEYDQLFPPGHFYAWDIAAPNQPPIKGQQVMKVGKLIQELEVIRNTYGDCDVKVATNGTFFGTDTGEAGSVTVIGIGTDTKVAYIAAHQPPQEGTSE